SSLLEAKLLLTCLGMDDIRWWIHINMRSIQLNIVEGADFVNLLLVDVDGLAKLDLISPTIWFLLFASTKNSRDAGVLH
ncbi:hypothetical protein PFISCL1PPCAC_12691, partial [Pristionchus fissidentatus]